MAQVIKMKNGASVQDAFNEAQYQYNQAFQNASDEAKMAANNYMQSLQNRINAESNNWGNRNTKEFMTQGYINGLKILNGTEEIPQVAVGNTWGTNMFGMKSVGASSRAADQVYYDYMTQGNSNSTGKTTSGGSSKTSSGGSGGGSSVFVYKGIANPEQGWDLGQNLDLDQRIRNYSNSLLSQLSGLNEALLAGNTVRGMDTNKQNVYLGYIRQLQQLANGQNMGQQGLQALAKIAQGLQSNGEAIDSDSFASYFDGFIDRNLQALKNDGYSEYDGTTNDFISKILNDNGLKLLYDQNHNLVVYNTDYSQRARKGLWYNDDWTQEGLGDNFGYDTGLFIDDNGNAYIGSGTNLDQNSQWYNQYNDWYNERNAKGGLYDRLHWTKQWGADSDSDNELLIKINQLLGNFNGVDVSQLFKGSDQIVAVNKGNKPFQYKGRQITFDNNTRFFMLDDNGNLTERTWNDLKGSYNRNGWKEDEEQTGSMDDITQIISEIDNTLTGDEDFAGRSYWDSLPFVAPFKGNFFKDYAKGLSGGLFTYFFMDNINEDPGGFIEALTDAVLNPNGRPTKSIYGVGTNKQFLQQIGWYDETKRAAILRYIFGYRSGPNRNVTSENTWEKYDRILRDWNRQQRKIQRTTQPVTTTEEQKDGGTITKAASGTMLQTVSRDPRAEENAPFEQTRKEEQRAREKGYGSDVYRMSENEKTLTSNFSAADAMRFTTMAQDVASIAASFVPGYGTAVAAGLGVTSMATDLVADIMDPAVSGGEVAKNAIFNLGFAALGAVPGAKIGKVGRTLLKYAPKIITAYAALNIATDESTQKTLKKLGDGSTAFTREDWRNLSHVLSLIAGGVRGVRQDVSNIKARADVRAVGKHGADVELKTLKGVKDVDGKQVKIKQQELDDLQTQIKDMDNRDDIINALKSKLNIDDTQAAKLISERGLTNPQLKKFKVSLEAEDGMTGLQQRYINQELAREDAILAEQAKTGFGRAAIWFGNKLGGGAYSARTRAMFNAANELAPNNYVSLIDFKNRRNGNPTTNKFAIQEPEYQYENPYTIEQLNAARAARDAKNSAPSAAAEMRRKWAESGAEEFKNNFEQSGVRSAVQNYHDARQKFDVYGKKLGDVKGKFKQIADEEAAITGLGSLTVAEREVAKLSRLNSQKNRVNRALNKAKTDLANYKSDLDAAEAALSKAKPSSKKYSALADARYNAKAKFDQAQHDVNILSSDFNRAKSDWKAQNDLVKNNNYRTLLNDKATRQANIDRLQQELAADGINYTAGYDAYETGVLGSTEYKSAADALKRARGIAKGFANRRKRAVQREEKNVEDRANKLIADADADYASKARFKGDSLGAKMRVKAYNSAGGTTDVTINKGAEVHFLNGMGRAEANRVVNSLPGVQRLDKSAFQSFVGEGVPLRGAALYTDPSGAQQLLLWRNGGMLNPYYKYNYGL